MIPLRGALYALGAALGLFLAVWGYQTYRTAQGVRVAQWRAELKAKDDSLKDARAYQLRTDTLYREGKTVYRAGRDRILNNPAKPASPEVKACYESADKLITACEIRHRADSAVAVQLEGKIRLLENKPNPFARRIQPYGEVGYDVLNQVPVIRVGATVRLLGPIAGSVAGEYAAPRAGKDTPAFRAVAGVRIAF